MGILLSKKNYAFKKELQNEHKLILGKGVVHS